MSRSFFGQFLRRIDSQMKPQSNILVIAPLKPERTADLRDLLASMNFVPGKVNPANALIPFEQLPQLHVARLVILDDHTLGDMETAYGVAAPSYPPYLAFLADFDGTPDSFRADLVRIAADGLDSIFSCCAEFAPGMDLAQWMKVREYPPATIYINWVGRTVQQIREENALRLALENHLQENQDAFAARTAEQTHSALCEFARAEISAARLTLTPPPATPIAWWLRNAADLIGVPLILLLLTPFLILYLPFFIFMLRSREKRDMEIAPRPDPACADQLALIEDYDVTNQFTAMGSLKPGLFRRTILVFSLWILNYTTRHIYTRGQLARVPTIHFARWVFIDNKKRLLFASNYDSSLSTYMDDFINKAGFGLNLVFSNGIGYPSSRWLVLDGAKDEQKFKYFLRRHELPTNVWYKAYPGLTAFDLKRNTLIRQGIERANLSGAELQQWVALL
jgi:hypothetical protein